MPLNEKQVLDQARSLAISERTLGGTAFRKVDFGQYSFPENQAREGVFRQTREIYRRETANHKDPRPGKSSRMVNSREGRLPVNPLESWVQLLTSTYKVEPERTFKHLGEVVDVNHPQYAVVEEIERRYREACINEVMDEVDTDIFLQWACCLVPYYDADNDELVIQRYTGPNIRVVENKANPKRPLATVFAGKSTELLPDGTYTLVDHSQVWTGNNKESRLQVYRGSTVVRDLIRPAPAPVVHVHHRNPAIEHGYWDTPPGVPLAQALMIMINEQFDGLGEAIVLQMFGIGQIFGQDKQQDVKIGPGNFLYFTGHAELREGVEFANPNPMLTETLEVLQAVMAQMRQDFGIPEAAFDTEGLMSGAAIREATGPLAEIRAARLKTFRRPETELFRRVGEELQLSGIQSLRNFNANDWDVDISFKTHEEETALSDKLALETHDFELGIINLIDIYRRRHEGVTREEALLELARLKEETALLNGTLQEENDQDQDIESETIDNIEDESVEEDDTDSDTEMVDTEMDEE